MNIWDVLGVLLLIVRSGCTNARRVSLGYENRVKLPCHREPTNLNLLDNTTVFSKWLHYFTQTPTHRVQKFLLPITSLTPDIIRLEFAKIMVSHYDFDFHFPDY